MARERTLKVKITDQKQGDGFKKAGKDAEGFRGKLKRLNKIAVKASLVVAGLAIVAGKEMVGLSRELTLMDQKAEAVFGDSLPRVQKWADGQKKAFGTTQTETVNLAAAFADLLKPMGFTTDEATKMSTEVVGLSGALANWSGGKFTAAEVSEKLSKAMLGEREELKSLGISIMESDVQARLAKKGQEGLTGAALQQAKAIATQELIFEKSTDAQKAWADGGKEAAEDANGATSSFNEMKESLARGLTPAIEKATDLFNKFGEWAQKNQGVVGTLGASVIGLAVAVLAVNAAVKVWNALKVVATALQWAWNAAMSANPIGLVILAIVALIAIIVLLIKNWDTVKKVAGKVWNWIWNKIKAVAGFIWEKMVWLKDKIVGVFNFVRDKIGGAWNTIKGKAGAAFNFIKNKASGAWNWVKDKAAGAKDWIVRKFNNLIDFFRRMPGRIKSAFSSFGSTIANGIKSIWNSTIGGFGFDVPSWVPGIGGRSFRIPYLHEGGIFGSGRGEGLAMLRDGEGVFTPEQMAALGPSSRGGDTVVIDLSGAVISSEAEFERMVVKALRSAGRKGVPITVRGRAL